MTHPIELFYSTFNERHKILKRKNAGESTLTADPVFQEWYFCNSYREDDKVTTWFRRALRTKYGGKHDLFATIAFRVFNWTGTGETLLRENLILDWDLERAVAAILKQDQKISGAYILKGHTCGCKVRGLAMIADEVSRDLDYHYETMMSLDTLAAQYDHLRTIPFIGYFTGYQKMQDLKYTHIAEGSKDFDTWCVAGPGAIRGLNRIAGRPVADRKKSVDYHAEILEIKALQSAHTDHYLNASDVQHWLCEFDKYSRILEGNRMKRRYK